MSISDQDFDQLLKLSHLTIDDANREDKSNLDKICVHVEQLSKLDLDGVEPPAGPAISLLRSV